MLSAKQSGAVGACWAHNPEVDGSKPFSAINVLLFFNPQVIRNLVYSHKCFFPSLWAICRFHFREPHNDSIVFPLEVNTLNIPPPPPLCHMIGYVPKMRLYTGQPSERLENGTEVSMTDIDYDFESIEWEEELPLSEAKDILDKTLYSFKKVTKSV